MKHKFYITAELQSMEETPDLRKEVASVIDLPAIGEQQPDLAYFSSIFVSTGTNLNAAHFLGSELVLAENTVVGKAVDVEHKEDQIIGHIYHCAFTDKEGNELPLGDLKGKSTSDLDKEEMHIVIASVVYKARFPEVFKDIQDKKFAVSMEAYYQNFDLMIGSTILTQNEARALGFDVANDSLYGKQAQIEKSGEIVDKGKVARVLRGICFSGVGIVKNPANPPSVVLETSSKNKSKNKDVIVLMDNITASENSLPAKEESELQYNDTYGLCVSYRKEVMNTVDKDQSTVVVHREWCNKFDRKCPVSGDAMDPKCLRFSVQASVKTTVEKKLKEVYKNNKIGSLTDKLIKALAKVKK